MKHVCKFGVGVAAACLLALTPARTEAATFSFTSCLENNSGLCTSVLSQLTLDVTDPGGGSVDFTFRNNVGIASSLTDLYFDAAAGLLGSLSIVSESAGVDFGIGASPGNVPGANGADPDFVVSVGLSADSEPPAAPNGINAAGESLTLRFGLLGSTDFGDVLAALGLGTGTDAGIRIAAHIQAVGAQGESDAVICCTPQQTPEPATLALFGFAALGAAYRVRRRATIE